MLKVAFCLEKQKSFIPKKIFLGYCQYQNKKALFTDPIFSEGFGLQQQQQLRGRQGEGKKDILPDLAIVSSSKIAV